MTHHRHIHNFRGFGAVFAQHPPGSSSEILAALQGSFEDFKGRYDRSLDDIAGQVAALRVGGGGGTGPGQPQNHRAAREALGLFAATGATAAMMRLPSAATSLSSDNDPKGGLLVPEEISQTIIDLQRDINPIRRLATVVPTRGQSYSQVLNKGGSSAGWAAERSPRPQTEGPNLVGLNIPTHEVYANPATTQALLDDAAISVGDFLGREIAKEFDQMEGSAFVSGDGVGKPRGFLTLDTTDEVDSVRAFGKLQYVKTGDASGFDATDPADALTQMVYALKAAHRRNAAWLMNSLTASIVARWKDGQGRYLWAQSIAAGQPSTLGGYPVEFCEDMPNVAAGEFPIAFGDWRAGYCITDRMEIRVLRDPFTNKPYVHFYTTKRVGGAQLDSNAIKLLKIAA